MNTRKVELIIGTLATFFFTLGLFYAFWQEPVRLEQTEVEVLAQQVSEAMTIYAQNCAVCHGAAGEGIGATPPLATDAMRSADPESLQKIISRGLYNTAMPAWSLEDGGPLSEYQIDTLVKLILFVRWDAVEERVVDLGLAPKIPFTTQPDPAILEAILAADPESPLVQGIQVYADTCVACHGADGLGSSLAPAVNTPEIRARTESQVKAVVENGVSGTIMAGWKNILTPDELTSVVSLLMNWDQIPSGAIPEPERNILVSEASLALGKQLYRDTCAACHGPEGQGTQRAPSLNVRGYLNGITDLALEQIITLGVPGTAMPAWGDRLTDVEIQALVGFIRSWEPTAPEVAQPARAGGGPWWQTTSGTNANSPKGKGGPWWRQQGQQNPPDQGYAAPNPQGSTVVGEPCVMTDTLTSPVSEVPLTSTVVITGSLALPGEASQQSGSHGSKPAWAGSGQGNPDANHSAATANQHLPGQGNTRWTQPADNGWWTSLDPRAMAILAGVLGSGIGLILAGIWGMMRFKYP